MRLRFAFALVAITALTGLIVGCSSVGDKNSYVDEVNKIQQSALDTVTKATAANPKNKGEYEAQLKTASDAIQKAIDDLGGVDVPSEATDSHQQFVDALTKMKGVFDKYQTKIHGASGLDLIPIQTSLSLDTTTAGNDVDAAITQINSDLGAG